jgi:methylmalonyl-CoA mutase N-terminal domain/subunit
VDPRIEREQVVRLRAFRAGRDSGLAGKSLEDLVAGAREDRNLVPPILEAVRSSATLGEIVGALKTVWGEHRPGA